MQKSNFKGWDPEYFEGRFTTLDSIFLLSCLGEAPPLTWYQGMGGVIMSLWTQTLSIRVGSRLKLQGVGYRKFRGLGRHRIFYSSIVSIVLKYYGSIVPLFSTAQPLPPFWILLFLAVLQTMPPFFDWLRWWWCHHSFSTNQIREGNTAPISPQHCSWKKSSRISLPSILISSNETIVIHQIVSSTETLPHNISYR